MAGVKMPEHIDAMRLVVATEQEPDTELANIILQNGLTIPEAVSALLDALSCPIPSVQTQVGKTLVRLYDGLEKEIFDMVQKRLSSASSDEADKRYINHLLEQIVKIKTNCQDQGDGQKHQHLNRSPLPLSVTTPSP
jgi:hypothetical protein